MSSIIGWKNSEKKQKQGGGTVTVTIRTMDIENSEKVNFV